MPLYVLVATTIGLVLNVGYSSGYCNCGTDTDVQKYCTAQAVLQAVVTTKKGPINEHSTDWMPKENRTAWIRAFSYYLYKIDIQETYGGELDPRFHGHLPTTLLVWLNSCGMELYTGDRYIFGALANTRADIGNYLMSTRCMGMRKISSPAQLPPEVRDLNCTGSPFWWTNFGRRSVLLRN